MSGSMVRPWQGQARSRAEAAISICSTSLTQPTCRPGFHEGEAGDSAHKEALLPRLLQANPFIATRSHFLLPAPSACRLPLRCGCCPPMRACHCRTTCRRTLQAPASCAGRRRSCRCALRCSCRLRWGEGGGGEGRGRQGRRRGGKGSGRKGEEWRGREGSEGEGRGGRGRARGWEVWEGTGGKGGRLNALL